MTQAPKTTAPSADIGKEDRHFVTALARGLDVLTCFSDARQQLGNQEIAERCGLPKSTVSRLTSTLTKLSYLEYVPATSKYRLGTASMALGASALNKFDVRLIAAPMMAELAEFSRSSISLGARERLNIVYIDNARGQSTFTLNVEAGWRVPLATTSIGRAYLSACAPAEQTYILDAIREEDPVNWPRLQESLQTAMAQYQELGCCCSFGDWNPEVNAIAVAFSRGPSQSPMAINCGGPAFSLTPEFLLEEVRPRMLAIARKIESSIQNLSY